MFKFKIDLKRGILIAATVFMFGKADGCLPVDVVNGVGKEVVQTVCRSSDDGSGVKIFCSVSK